MENSIFVAQVKELLQETDMIAALSNVSACIMMNYKDLNWAGFYFSKNGELVLGPFQGKPACTHIPFDKGVCGATYTTKKVQRIENVLSFKGHIACDSASKSELCVPVLIENECKIMIDLDAPIVSRFTETEEKEMLIIASFIQEAYYQHHWTLI